MKTNVNNDVTVNQIHRIQVTSYSNAWHRTLLGIVAAYWRCVVVNRKGSLWIAGANRSKAKACRCMFLSLRAQLRAAARNAGCSDRASTVAFYTEAVAALSSTLKVRHLPAMTQVYAEKHAA